MRTMKNSWQDAGTTGVGVEAAAFEGSFPLSRYLGPEV